MDKSKQRYLWALACVHQTAIYLSCLRQDKRFPRNNIRAQSSIKCKQIAYDKIADPQINNSAVSQNFFVRGIKGNIGYVGKRSDKCFESAIKGKHKRRIDII